MMRYVHLRVSPAGCFGWLCTLCFTVVFFKVLFQRRKCMLDFLMWAYQLKHTALCLPIPRSAQTQLRSALCLTDYFQNLVGDGPSKVFFPPQVNKGQVTLLNFT